MVTIRRRLAVILVLISCLISSFPYYYNNKGLIRVLTKIHKGS